MSDDEIDVFAGLKDFCANKKSVLKNADCCEYENVQQNESKETSKNQKSPVTTIPNENLENQKKQKRQSYSLRSSKDLLNEAAIAIVEAPIIEAPLLPKKKRNKSKRSRANQIQSETSLEIIDLTSTKEPPPFSCTEIITLDSGDETTPLSDSLDNISFDTDNPIITVKVIWRDNVEIFEHRQHQKFEDIMAKFASKENVNISDIFLLLNETIIKPSDTPDSIGYEVFHFITGRVVSNSTAQTIITKKDADTIKITVQLAGRKKPFFVNMKKAQTLKILYIKCSEELKTSVSQLQLSFDGETLKPTLTPNDLNFEEGDVIDCYIKK